MEENQSARRRIPRCIQFLALLSKGRGQGDTPRLMQACELKGEEMGTSWGFIVVGANPLLRGTST